MATPMIRETDVPSFAALERREDIPGGNGGEPALRSHVPAMRSLLWNRVSLIAVDAVTGSGKTRVLPPEAQQIIGGQLLLVARSTLDVVKLHREFKCRTSYRMGGHRKGGVHISQADIVIVTAGLAMRWYAESGERFLSHYRAVFFDELGEMEVDPEYALLFDVALRIREQRGLIILAAGSALSPALQQRLTGLDSQWIRCDQRSYLSWMK